MNEEQANAIVHSITGVPKDAQAFARGIAWEMGLNLIRACQVLDGDLYGGSVDSQLWQDR